MEVTGMYRRVDQLGRIVIPKKIRKTIEIKNGDLLEFFLNNDAIILRKCNTTIGLSELVRRLGNEFSGVKDDLDVEVARRIKVHIDALQGILKNIDIN